MGRTIDADNLAEGLKYHYQPTDQECDFDRQWAVGYNAGLNRALYSIAYARTIEPKQEWISVKDRLPEEEQDVLIYSEYYDIDKGLFTRRYGFAMRTGFICEGDFIPVGEISHWMPLPEPPEAK